MIERLGPLPGGYDRHPENFLDPLLADELTERARPQRQVEYALLLGRRRGRERPRLFVGSVGGGLLRIGFHFSPIRIANDLRIITSRSGSAPARETPPAAVTESTARFASPGL